MATTATDTRWADVQRLEGWAGEVRVNLIRLAAIVAFYGHHLIHAFVLSADPSVRGRYHAAVTAAVLAWGALVLLLYVCLSRRWVPAGLKYFATATDLVLITGMLALTGDGPKSPLVVLYFLVIAAAPLRLSMGLVYMAALGAIVGYLFLLGHYAYWVVGYERYYADPALRIPRTHQVIMVLALGAAGIVAGQVVRQMRRVAEGYPVKVKEPSGG
jgi:hypothetical protein